MISLHEYRSSITSLAALIGGATLFFWISRGTEFHQLAIGILLSAITLTIALALFELCWRVGISAARLFGLENSD
jgi:ABC-type proline/glycine betaine transport system permease subunit